MKLRTVAVVVSFAWIACIGPSALCEDVAPLSARLSYRDDYPANSAKRHLLLDDVAMFYMAARNLAPGANPAQECPKALVFRITRTQPTQDVQWVSIPLATLSSIEFEWLSLPRSTVGFKSLRMPVKGGGSHSLDVIVDGREYRYIRKGKSGAVEKDVTGALELRTAPSAAPMVGGFRSDLTFELFGVRGIGAEKQRPHSPDNEWIIKKEFIDRVEFVEDADAGQVSEDAARDKSAGSER